MAILGGSRLGRPNTNMSQPHQNVQQQPSANRENEPSEKNVTSKVERNQRDRKIEVYSTNVQSKGMVEERRDGYVVEDWDITNLKVGQAIIGFPEYEPFVFQFDLWDQK